MKKTVIGVIGVIGALLALSGCPANVASGTDSTGGSPVGSGLGSLTVDLPLTPMADPKNPDPGAISNYDLVGTGPGTASFQRRGVTGGTTTIDSLAVGNWSLLINAENAGATVIFTATVLATVVQGTTASAEVTQGQLHSNSTLAISLTWPTSQQQQIEELTLSAVNGGTVTISTDGTSSVGEQTTFATTVAVAPGYYTLSRVFQNASGFRVGGVVALRVLPGEQSSFSLVANASGAVFKITPDGAAAGPITFSAVKDTYGKGQVIAVTATPGTPAGKGSGPAVFQWYLNGAPIAGQSASTVQLSGLDAGPYRLDCVVAGGGALSSGSVTFTVTGSVGGA